MRTFRDQPNKQASEQSGTMRRHQEAPVVLFPCMKLGSNRTISMFNPSFTTGKTLLLLLLLSAGHSPEHSSFPPLSYQAAVGPPPSFISLPPNPEHPKLITGSAEP
ncbi:hypothetical protein GOODEAATRI_018526 [Goodea atripinnis]|uniref:Uncharacterized protein n=1 Tax=Goodea atripinnis TaxID=208336 RepID=A0ABV0PZP5_9TELE